MELNCKQARQKGNAGIDARDGGRQTFTTMKRLLSDSRVPLTLDPPTPGCHASPLCHPTETA